MIPRRFMKKCHRRVTNEENISFTDERIKQLIREYMDTDNLNKKKTPSKWNKWHNEF